MQPAQEGNDAIALAESRFHAANMLRDRGALREAEQAYLAALEAWPAFLEAFNNLGMTLRAQGRIEEAIECYCAAIAIDPDCPQPHLNLGMARLFLGDFAKGLPEYEWRLRLPNQHLRRCEQPMWDGKPFAGKTILLHPDQGFGDTILFARYAPLVKALGGQVILECQAPLARLLQSLKGADCVIAKGEPLPPFDLHAPLPSLPYLLKSTLETIPRKHPYLAAPQELCERWQRRLEGFRRFRIGICWECHPSHPDFAIRSAPLDSLRDLAGIPGVQLFSLQKGPGALSNGKRRPPFSIVDLDPELSDFADTAAAIETMDLVVTADTSVAHVAAALGKPTWMFLQSASDWKWMLDRTDTPWYSAMRIFRQRKPGDWSTPLREISSAIPATMFEKGNALSREGKHAEASEMLACVARALPNSAETSINLGVSLKVQDRLEEAEAELRRAVGLAPHAAEAWNSLGNAQFNLRKYNDAEFSFGQALHLQPEFVEARINRGMLRLALGDFERGWEEYAWRLKTGEHALRSFSQPLWNGESIEGKSILLYAEQGFGDSIQFIRYASLVSRCGAKLLIECQKPLKDLFAHNFSSATVFARGEALPAFDFRAPLMHLPMLFGSQLGNIPAASSYLFADPRQAAPWKEKLAGISKRKIAVCWASNPQHPSGMRKSIPEQLAQKFLATEEAHFLDLTHLPSAVVQDFAQAAAVLSCADLVLSVDTAIAHLGAALGRPTWLLLPYSAEWRWLTQRDDSPWYPTMRLFRQTAPGDWGTLLDTVAAQLREDA